MESPDPLALAIADLQSRRGVLGNTVVDAAVAVLRREQAAAAASQPQPAGPAAHGGGLRLRQVSVLFADVADSTALLAQVAVDEADEVLGRALQRFADLVQAAGGEVLRFTGDGLKAAFGHRGAQEDAAERAVRAGLQILQAAAAHGSDINTRHAGLMGWRFGVRLGIHTGPVLLGGGPEADRAAMGHAVHLAARLEQSAPVGGLRISAETQALARGLFQMQPQPPLRVKGHDGALHTWLVSAEAHGAERAAQRGIEGLATPLVGRAAELQALTGLWQRCRQEGCAGFALVLADAGVGKTRLRQALLQQLEAPALQARAHPSDRLRPYALLHQLLARWLDLGDVADAATARARFVERLLPWLRGGRQADATLRAQRLGQLLGLDFSDQAAVTALGPRELRDQALRTLAELLQALAAQQPGQPLLVVLDDVHWADNASLDACERLLQPAAGGAVLPVMWLWLARPVLLQQRAATLPPALAQLQLVLQPLGTDAAAELADALLAKVAEPPAALRQMLVARAQGNPYFMEELLRRLLSDTPDAPDAVIDTSTTPWRVHAGRLAALRLPETLVGLLQTRLDTLPAPALEALQQASIVGPVFWRGALAALDAAAPAQLPLLQQQAAVAALPHSRFAQEAEHGFTHPLLHEVTYGTVLRPARQAGHAQAARWLATRMAGREREFQLQLAQHLEQAGDTAAALVAYRQALGDARDRFAHTEALALADRALALAGTLPPPLTPVQHFRLQISRHTVLDNLGRRDEAAAQVAAMQAFAERHDDDAMRAEITSTEMLCADHDGDPARARALAEATLALAARADAARAAGAAALAHGELAWLALQQQQFAQVQAQVDAGLVDARLCATLPREAGGYDGYELQLQNIAIQARIHQAQYQASDQALLQALATLDGRSKPFTLDRFHLLALRCEVQRELGDLALAQQLADDGSALAARLEMPRIDAAALAQQVEVALCRGDAARARDGAEAVEQLAHTWGYQFLLPGVWRWRGELAWQAQDTAAAASAWQRAASLYAEQQRAPDALQLRCRLAALALRPADGGSADAPGADALQQAAAAVHAALQEADADQRPHRGLLQPEALLDCHAVLAATGSPLAASVRDDLSARLQQQLQQLPDAAARQRLLQQVPHWRAVQQLLHGRAP